MPDRQFYIPEVGTELKADNTVFDVQAWRDQIKADAILKSDEEQAKLDTIDASVQEVKTEINDEAATTRATIDQLFNNVFTTVDESHKNTELGKSFMAFNNSAILNIGSSISIYFETSSDTEKVPHLIIEASGSDIFDFKLLESPVVTSNSGASAVIYNRNRTSSTESSVKDNATTPVAGSISRDVTITGSGTVLQERFVSSGEDQGGSITTDRGLILNTSTKYAFVVTSQSAGLRCNINLFWHE